MEPIIDVTDSPEPEALTAIARGLRAYNEQQSGKNDRRSLSVIIRDPRTQEPLGGITGRTNLGLMFIDVFYLPETCRGQGLGSKLLAAAENEARRRSCMAGVLYTISFQAPGFYERHGWRTFAEIPCDPPGTRRIFMTKEL